MVLAELIGRVRKDYKILTRSLLTDVDQIADFMIPVPFDHEEDAIAKSIEMRMRAMEHLANDGVIVIFPSGKVASSDTMMGPVVEREWNPFTAKMIQRSKGQCGSCLFSGRKFTALSDCKPNFRNFAAGIIDPRSCDRNE